MQKGVNRAERREAVPDEPREVQPHLPLVVEHGLVEEFVSRV